MSSRLVVIGGGEHARVVIEAAMQAGRDVAGFLDPEAGGRLTRLLNVPRLGTDADASDLGDVAFVLGMGRDVRIRQQVASRYEANGVSWTAIAHPAAWVSPSAHIGAGSVVMAGAMINSGAQIGRHVIVNTSAVIEHDAAVGDHSLIGPGAVVGGGAQVGAGATIGLRASIRDHIVVGTGAVVGMGAVVVADVEPGTTVMGVPARNVESN